MRHFAVAFLVSAALALPAAAGPVTGLTSFTPGMPARASEVNGNFGIVATAVNDNHTRLSTAETTLTGKQNRVTGTCAEGSAMSAVAADGSVTCVPLASGGVVSVPNTAFVESKIAFVFGGCVLTHFRNESFFLGSATSGGCFPLAPLSLPQGATLTSLSCRVRDTIDFADITMELYRQSLSADTEDFLFQTPESVDAGWQTILDASVVDPAKAVVDNTAFVYGLFARFSPDGSYAFDDIANNLSIVACNVAYAAP